MEAVGKPLIQLEPNKATIELTVMIQVFINSPDGPIINLLVLRADLVLNVRLSISRGSLVLALSLGRLALLLESSDVGIRDISNLKPQFFKLLVETYMPLLNAAVTPGLPVPNLFKIPMTRMHFQILKGMLVILL